MVISGPSEYAQYIDEEGLTDTPERRKMWLRAWNRAWEVACDACLEVVESN